MSGSKKLENLVIIILMFIYLFSKETDIASIIIGIPFVIVGLYLSCLLFLLFIKLLKIKSVSKSKIYIYLLSVLILNYFFMSIYFINVEIVSYSYFYIYSFMLNIIYAILFFKYYFLFSIKQSLQLILYLTLFNFILSYLING